MTSTNTQFYTATVQFSGSGSTISGSASHTFDTNIIDLTAAIQSWTIRTGSDREIKNFNMIIDNIQKDGATADCKVTLTLASTEPKWSLEVDDCSVDVIFIANCE